jgi:hypothetical protein
MTTPVEIIDLAQYDTIPVDAILAYLYMMGIITDVNDPNNIAYTMEAFNNQPVLTVPVLKGQQGEDGPDAITLRFQDKSITDLDSLPTDLGDTVADLGKFWLYAVVDSDDVAIATIIYLWTGTLFGPLSDIVGLGQGWVQIPVGSPGPPGPYPNLSAAELIPTAPGNGDGPNDSDSWIAINDNSIQTITVTGTPSSGSFKLIAEIGNVSDTTGTIAHNAISAASIQTALAALGNIGSDNVIVTGDGPYTVSFTGPIDSEGIDVLVITASTLVGGSVSVASGTALAPSMAWYLAIPAGEQGPTAPLGSFYNVDFVTKVPSPGDIFTCSERLTPGAPTSLGKTASSSGGAISAGTYYWVVTATLPNGETVASNEVSATLTGSTSSVLLSWTAPSGAGATGYNVYRGTATGAEDLLCAVIVSGTQTTFRDVGAATVSGSPPVSSGIVSGKNIWVPVTPLPQAPLLYTIPQTAFSGNQIGIEFGQTQPTVGTFNLPQQPFAFVPVVFGQVQLSGINIGFTPLLVGAEVLLGNSSHGQAVASGLSDVNGVVTMIPDFGTLEFSSNNFGGALVPAFHTGTVGTLYVNLLDEGLVDVYDYTNAGSGLSVLMLPILNTVAVVASVISASAKIPPPTVAVS